MMNRYLSLLLSVALLSFSVLGCNNSGGSDNNFVPQNDPPASQMTIKMGAASSPKYGSVFDAMTRDFERAGQPFEFTLYQNYYQLVDAFMNGEVDIAWNTPIAHARLVKLTNGQVDGPIARDVDIKYTTQLIVRKDSGINTLQDILGKTVAIGSMESQELNILPCYYMEQEGIDLETQTTLVNLNGLVDDQMNALSTATHIFNAVLNGDVDAGFVGDRLTRPLTFDPNHPLKVIWTSPGFTHCIFTTRKNYNPLLLQKFKEVLLAETLEDPIGRQVLIDEGCDRVWHDSQNPRDEIEGFADVLDAMDIYQTPLTSNVVPEIRLGALSSTAHINALKALERYFLRESGPAFEFLLYGTQKQLDNALLSGRIDVAFNEPLAHAKLLADNTDLLAPLTSDTDINYNFQVVVRKDSGINTLSDLTNRTLVTGSEDRAEISVLPRVKLPQAGLNLDTVTIVSLDKTIESDTRKRTDTDAHIADAVENGTGHAGVVGKILGDEIAADPDSALKVIHVSSDFRHRTMTARSDINSSTLNAFNQLMQAMEASDPIGAVVLSNENATSWVPNSNEGYTELVDAVRTGK